MSHRTHKKLTINKTMDITDRTDFYDNGLTFHDMDKVFQDYGDYSIGHS